MKRVALIAAALVSFASLGLAGCGHSDNANAPASADNVEMPAEEALSGVTAAPAADPNANASDGTSAAPSDQAASAASAAAGAASDAASN